MPNSAVVLSLDRLGAAWLGPYGNTWVDTPQFCRLAAESIVCETVLADSPRVEQACRAWWAGRHVLDDRDDGTSQPLPALTRQAGAEAVLVADDPAVVNHPLASSFSRVISLPQPAATGAAEEPGQTAMFRLIEAAIATLGELRWPFLLWIHSRGMAGPWDAPLPLRQQFADEEDPTPPEFVDPPEQMLSEGYDPDELLGLMHAYAGQVALADMGLGLLLDALEAHPLAAKAALAVTSPRGYPLGEHRRVGPCDEALYGELLHVPLIVRLADRQAALTRSQQILQPQELYYAIAETCGWSGEPRSRLLAEVRGRELPPPAAAVSHAPGQRAIRTPAWFLRQAGEVEERQNELFAKPDDRFEVNEVSSRCHDVVELLVETLDSLEAGLKADRRAEPRPLPEPLIDIWR